MYALGRGLHKFGMNAHLRLLSTNRPQLARVAGAVNDWRGVHTGPHGGTLSRQGLVGVDGTVMMFDDAFGGPGAVISRCASAFASMTAETCEGLRDMGISVVALSDVDDVNDPYGGWLDELGADTLIIRPDFRLFGTSAATETVDLIEDFFGARKAVVSAGGAR